MLRSLRLTAPRAVSQLAPRAALLRTTAARLSDAPPAASSPGAMTFSFSIPDKAIYEDVPVEMVILPGGDGMFGVMPNHVPTIAELMPGIVSVQEETGGPLVKYFISGGFAMMTDTSKLNVTVLEAVSIDDIDPEAVKTGLAQYAAAYASANATDLEKSEAEIGVNVYQAMSYAIAE